MAKHFNLSLGDIYEQPDFSVSQNQNGGWEGSRSYCMLRDTWNQSATKNRFARRVSITTADSTVDSFYSFLTVRSASPTEEDGEHVRLVVHYSGAPSSQYGGEGGGDLSLQALPTYRLTGQLRDLPFSKHWKWKALDESQRYALGLLMTGDAIRDPEDNTKIGFWNDETFFHVITPDGGAIVLEGDALKFAKRIGEGESTFESPTFTWEETTQGDAGLNNNQLNKLGKVSTPRGNPPSVSSTDRDWKLETADQHQRGELITTRLLWKLSEQGGHDEFLYND